MKTIEECVEEFGLGTWLADSAKPKAKLFKPERVILNTPEVYIVMGELVLDGGKYHSMDVIRMRRANPSLRFCKYEGPVDGEA